ncbi:MAG: hypothetical protein JO133_01200 [Burkholderiaceae bacterium]|nr:hypothetical protein [Burkholderiaceae bacterium]
MLEPLGVEHPDPPLPPPPPPPPPPPVVRYGLSTQGVENIPDSQSGMKSHAILPESSNSSITFGLTTEVAPTSIGVVEMSVGAAPASVASPRPKLTRVRPRRITFFMVDPITA